MIYADTDFFLAMLKGSDWLKRGAKRLLRKHRGQLWTSEVTLTELLLLAKEFSLDPRRLLVDAMAIARVDDRIGRLYLTAANVIKQQGVGVFDALHAAYCGHDQILSSDKVFDRLGLDRIALKP